MQITKTKRRLMKLAIGIPNMGDIKQQTVFSLVRMLKDFPHDYDVIFKQGSVLHQMREDIVKKAIELNCTHLLFLDSDMCFEKDAVLRLIAHDKDIIGVNAHLRKLPLTSTIKASPNKVEKIENGEYELTTCNAVGTGFTLIKLDVFKKLSHPWFFWKSNKKGELVMGEDFWFCKKAREAGYKIWVDLTIPVGHIGNYIF